MSNLINFKFGVTILLILFAPLVAYCQSYIPTIGEGKEWELRILDVESQTYQAHYFTACDTVFNGLVYKSIIRKSNSERIAYVREDDKNRKIYYLPLDLSGEILIVDYSLEAGDTFIMRGYPNVVQSVGTETIFGAARTVIYLQGGVKFIEGVGHSWYGVLNWLLEGLFNTVTGINDNQATCEQITFTSDPADEVFTIYPNPVVDKIILNIGNIDLLNMPMALFTMQGTLVKSWTYQNDPIDMSYLQSGVYFLKISDKTFKVIKK